LFEDLESLAWGKIALNAIYVAGITFFALYATQDAVICLKPTLVALGGAFFAGMALEMRKKGLFNEPPGNGGKITAAVLFL